MDYHVLIVDDELPASNKLSQFFTQIEREVSIFTAATIEEAYAIYQSQPLDFMLLDIELTRSNVFRLIEKIGIEHCPRIIFSTAYNQYAVKAFELHAVDYLLKPYDFARFELAINRVFDQLESTNQHNHMLAEVIDSFKKIQPAPKILWVNQSGRLVPLKLNEILYLESDGNYVQIYTDQHKYIVKKSLAELSTKLASGDFVRVHRSFMVNINYVQMVFPKSHGDMFAKLHGTDVLIPISRNYKSQLIL